MHPLFWRSGIKSFKYISTPSIPSLTPPHLLNSQSKTLAMVKSSSDPSSQKRAMCLDCSKPTRTCLCSRLQIQPPGLDNPVRVTVLQHSLEAKHPLNSTRILRLGLRNVTVASVSDVNSGAQFRIECSPGFTGESSDFDEPDTEIDSTQKLGESLYEERSELSGLEQWARNADGVDGTACRGGVESGRARDGRVPLIDIAMAKKGAIISIRHVWMSPDCEGKNNLCDVLESRPARDALAKGFLVRKLQKREVGLAGGELDEFEEFRLEVPAGSLLLFPSEKALTVDEIKEAGFKVKNLIVLDGTWMKARRMYNENPWLRFLPHLKLDLDMASLYQEVRSQPKEGYLSTVESVVYAMKSIGDYTEGLSKLLIAFEVMVNDQRQCKDERLRNVKEG
ncbi:hypothetical protein MLD38_000688 [Melastoma candidum]|uniref:Uncharacterized protein n=1 Tax=Melastoma candidum TaxID=119954 RepID=A0ACB9SEU4_9MYRT|nr:hypothetical protein MLD38_000688 [Melastoma candidum]